MSRKQVGRAAKASHEGQTTLRAKIKTLEDSERALVNTVDSQRESLSGMLNKEQQLSEELSAEISAVKATLASKLGEGASLAQELTTRNKSLEATLKAAETSNKALITDATRAHAALRDLLRDTTAAFFAQVASLEEAVGAAQEEGGRAKAAGVSRETHLGSQVASLADKTEKLQAKLDAAAAVNPESSALSGLVGFKV
ncbi:hypothetical protein T484DRAFT_1804210 [Baffinella frigidus]|nr:hypothetical protein T484DRAFT_1804210 [Cryptophyta sp. CCMP2293]